MRFCWAITPCLVAEKRQPKSVSKNPPSPPFSKGGILLCVLSGKKDLRNSFLGDFTGGVGRLMG